MKMLVIGFIFWILIVPSLVGSFLILTVLAAFVSPLYFAVTWFLLAFCTEFLLCGPFWIIPFADSISTWIDQRVITTAFAAEETLTSDTVPVNVDAVLFWVVYDPEKAALEVQNYPAAVSWAA